MGTGGMDSTGHLPVVFYHKSHLALVLKRPGSVKEVEANACVSAGPQGGCPGEALAPALDCPWLPGHRV